MDHPQPAGFSFVLSIGDDPPSSAAAFAEVSGLSSELKTQAITEGGENRFVHKVPVPVTHGNLVLRRGIVARASPLADWIVDTFGGSLGTPIATQTLSLGLCDMGGDLAIRWTFVDAWPVKWAVAPIADDDQIAVESLEFAYASMSRSAGG